MIRSGDIVCITGAGGKTTTMFSLARSLPGACLTTTTTKVGTGQTDAADCRMSTLRWLEEGSAAKCTWVSDEWDPSKPKQTGLSPESFGSVSAACKERSVTLLCEADGAHMRHIKAPAAHEPVVPPETDVLIYICGLDTVGLPMTEAYVHRPELFTALTGRGYDEAIRCEDIVRLIRHPEGGMKGLPEHARMIVLLSHCDSPQRRRYGQEIAAALPGICVRLSDLDPQSGMTRILK